jgi:seryl-tRNA synthetase
MHDIRVIREDPAAFDHGLARRGLGPVAAGLLQLDERRRALLTEVQTLQARRNEASKAIGQAKAKKDEETAATLMAEVAAIKDRTAALDHESSHAQAELDAALAALPNLPVADVPAGEDEDGNVEQSRWGRAISPSRPATMPISARRLAWILKQALPFPVPASRCCAERWRGFIARSANICSIRRAA